MKTKTLLDKNKKPIQIEQSQVRGLEEALANSKYKAGNGITISTDGTISVTFADGDSLTYGG